MKVLGKMMEVWQEKTWAKVLESGKVVENSYVNMMKKSNDGIPL